MDSCDRHAAAEIPGRKIRTFGGTLVPDSTSRPLRYGIRMENPKLMILMITVDRLTNSLDRAKLRRVKIEIKFRIHGMVFPNLIGRR
jgi:hypothetical protein